MRNTDDVESLARRARDGDPAALNVLLADLEPLVVRATRLIVGAGSWAAEDAAQEALLDVVRGIHSLREPGAIKTWALRVATQRALKVSNRERRFTRRCYTEIEWSAEAADGRAQALKDALTDCLHDCARRLCFDCMLG